MKKALNHQDGSHSQATKPSQVSNLVNNLKFWLQLLKDVVSWIKWETSIGFQLLLSDEVYKLQCHWHLLSLTHLPRTLWPFDSKLFNIFKTLKYTNVLFCQSHQKSTAQDDFLSYYIGIDVTRFFCQSHGRSRWWENIWEWISQVWLLPLLLQSPSIDFVTEINAAY